MAGELQVTYDASKTVYVLIFDRTGQVWNGSSFVAYSTGDYTSYDVALTELGTASGIYTGTFPAAIVAGVYSILAKNQAGGTPAQTDAVIAVGDYQWNGTVTLPLSDLATSGQVGTATPIRMARGIAVSGFPFYMVSSADHITPFTSGVISGQISRDGGSFGALQSGLVVGAYVEMGLGWYRCSLTSGDLTATTVALNFQGVGISGGSADPRNMALVLQKVSGSV